MDIGHAMQSIILLLIGAFIVFFLIYTLLINPSSSTSALVYLNNILQSTWFTSVFGASWYTVANILCVVVVLAVGFAGIGMLVTGVSNAIKEFMP